MDGAYTLGLAEAARAIRDGSLKSEELVKSCLKRIDEFEPSVQAWTHINPEHALEQARAADKRHYDNAPSGPLNGVPVGIKDIIDTSDYPTEFGSPIHEGRQPYDDATLVSRLRDAGAVIMGKTVTTEFAVYAPGKTTNPHDPARTPGGLIQWVCSVCCLDDGAGCGGNADQRIVYSPGQFLRHGWIQTELWSGAANRRPCAISTFGSGGRLCPIC